MYFNPLRQLLLVFILANSAGTDEMLHIVAFHLELHCLSKPVYVFLYTKDLPVKVSKHK